MPDDAPLNGGALCKQDLMDPSGKDRKYRSNVTNGRQPIPATGSMICSIPSPTQSPWWWH